MPSRFFSKLAYPTFSLVVFFQFLCVSLLHSHKETKESVAICAIFQNEASYLREWIEFHKLVGVRHFYLFNHMSTDHYREVLAPYIKSREVELIDWLYNVNPDGSNWPTIQISAYDHALSLARNKYKWLVIIDTDEFLFPVQEDSLSKFLRDYEDVAALCVNWQLYGTSGVEKIAPHQLMIEELTFKAPTDYPENVHVKSIVQPKYVERCVTPHDCLFLPGFFQVNADKEPFWGPFSSIKIDKIRINHYWTRDEHFFYNVKLARRQKWQDEGSIERANRLNQEEDGAILKYVRKLKKAMGIKKN